MKYQEEVAGRKEVAGCTVLGEAAPRTAREAEALRIGQEEGQSLAEEVHHSLVGAEERRNPVEEVRCTLHRRTEVAQSRIALGEEVRRIGLRV